jgi:fibronectin type 3 domain-containing protein
MLLLAVRGAFAGDVTLQWDPSAEADVVGYKVYYGTATRTYSSPIPLGLQTSYTVTGLAAGTYYFAVTAFDGDGLESAFSNEVSTSVGGTGTSVTCDVDGDGQLTVTDVQTVSDAVLAASSNLAYDINKDGKVDIQDVQTMVNIVLGIRSCP